MSEFVRIRLPNGSEVSLSRAFVEGLPDGAVEVLDVPATNLRGVPLPATRKNGRRIKPRTTVEKEAATKAASNPPSDPGPSDSTLDGAAVKPEEASA